MIILLLLLLSRLWIECWIHLSLAIMPRLALSMFWLKCWIFWVGRGLIKSWSFLAMFGLKLATATTGTFRWLFGFVIEMRRSLDCGFFTIFDGKQGGACCSLNAWLSVGKDAFWTWPFWTYPGIKLTSRWGLCCKLRSFFFLGTELLPLASAWSIDWTSPRLVGIREADWLLWTPSSFKDVGISLKPELNSGKPDGIVLSSFSKPYDSPRFEPIYNFYGYYGFFANLELLIFLWI